MKKVMLVFGTRPEAIKMCPLVNELKKRKNIEKIVCVTGQHRQMLDQVLETFNVVPDYDLAIMKQGQTLFDITTGILEKIKAVLENVKPDIVLVHGDTTTTFVTALASICKFRSDMWRPVCVPTIFTARIQKNSIVRQSELSVSIILLPLNWQKSICWTRGKMQHPFM